MTKCALFIDCENIPAALFSQITKYLEGYQLCAKKAYANWRIASPWSEILDHYGIEPVQVFHKGLKNSSDLRLCLDCLAMAYERADITHYALVTSDSDFRHLVFKLLGLGKEVIGFGESKTDADYAGICTQFHKLIMPEKQESEPEAKPILNPQKPQTSQKNDIKSNFLKDVIWICSSKDDFISIGYINGQMMKLNGRGWNVQTSGFKNWAGFFKANAGLFDLAYENSQNHTGMKIKLKTNALLKF